MSQAHKRLQRELIGLQKESPPGIRAKPLESDILQWHYVIEGPTGTPYAGGFYHGLVRFPNEYPFKPPSVMMYSPSGRFQTNTRICLSMSDFHPETWNPVWSVSSILVGVQSFLVDTAPTAGSVESSDVEKKFHAKNSLDFNLKNKDFKKLFPELVELRAKQLEDEAKAAAEEAEKAAATGGLLPADVGGISNQDGSTARPNPAPQAAAAAANAKGGGAFGTNFTSNLIIFVIVAGLVCLFALFGSGAGGDGDLDIRGL
jgi:ubiquitin-conjugating enzyme E2 J2